MSLILEALRKSEAERRRGLPPDLHAELPPVPSPRVPARAGAWMAAAAVLLVFAAWWLLRDAPPQGAAVPQPTTPTVPPVPAPQPQPSPAQLPARTPAAVAQPSTSMPAPAPAPGSTSASAPSAARAPDTVAAAAARSAPNPSEPPAAPPPSPAEASASAAAAGDGRVLSLAELDPGTRKALPPLKLSMHLWAEQPAQRFVILDGQRLGEGDRIGDASLVRIERDAVLLEWHGRGIRIPVR